MTTSTERILARTEPCRCGCNGTDPQHRASFRRVVRDRRSLSEIESPWSDLGGVRRRVAEVGRVRLPWGEVAVERDAYELNGRTTFGAWTLTRA